MSNEEFEQFILEKLEKLEFEIKEIKEQVKENKKFIDGIKNIARRYRE